VERIFVYEGEPWPVQAYAPSTVDLPSCLDWYIILHNVGKTQ